MFLNVTHIKFNAALISFLITHALTDDITRTLHARSFFTLAVWAGAKSCWKMKSIFTKLVSRRKHEVLQNFLVNGWSDIGFQKTQWTNTPNHHRLWKLNTGLQSTWAMSFSTLPPDSRTLVSNEIQNLLSSENRTLDHWATVQFFFSLAQVRRLWHNCAKFLDTSVCGGSWCLDPSLSPFLVKFTQIL